MKYVKILILGQKKVFAYRHSILLNIFAHMVSIIILQKFWFALYGNDYKQYIYMANYAVISQILSIVYQVKSSNKLASNIRTGGISIELLRPWNYIVSLICEDIGYILGNLLSAGMALFVISRLIFKLVVPSIKNFCLFFIAVTLAFVILFLIRTIVAMACFWLIESSSLLILTNVIVNLLSGQFLPTWLMPDWLSNLMQSLPFVWIYQKPIGIYLSSLNSSSITSLEYINFFSMQIVWIILLCILAKFIWNKAITKLSIQGG